MQRAFLVVLDTQFALGLLLYLGLSPLPRAGASDLGATIADGVLRFYTIEHVFGMAVALAVAHVGLRRARGSGAGASATTDRARAARLALDHRPLDPLAGRCVWETPLPPVRTGAPPGRTGCGSCSTKDRAGPPDLVVTLRGEAGLCRAPDPLASHGGPSDVARLAGSTHGARGRGPCLQEIRCEARSRPWWGSSR